MGLHNSLQHLHIDRKTYIFRYSKVFSQNVYFCDCLHETQWAFISLFVCMFWQPQEVWSLVNDDVLIWGTGKAWIHTLFVPMSCHYSTTLAMLSGMKFERGPHDLWKSGRHHHTFAFDFGWSSRESKALIPTINNHLFDLNALYLTKTRCLILIHHDWYIWQSLFLSIGVF